MSNHPVEDASDAGYVLDILDLTLTPAAPRLGHRLRWELDGHLRETVDLTRVTYRVIMKIGPLKILDKSYRLPDLLTRMGTRLSGDPRPPAGPWRQTWDLQIPRAVPVARHRIHLRARTAEGKNFLALNTPVAFAPPSRATAGDHIGPPDRPGPDRDLSRSR
ncbi:hypothetical protein [Streptomyces sp. JNUCC 63]